MKTKILFLLVVFVFFAFLTSACGATEEELAAAAEAGAEKALAEMPATDPNELLNAARQGAADSVDRWVASQPPTPEQVSAAEIAAELLALMPATATPVPELPVVEEELAEEAVAEPAPAPTPEASAAPIVVQGNGGGTIVVTQTLTTSAPTLTPTFTLELSEYYTMPVTMAGWSPIELSQNGDWYNQHTVNDSWDSIEQTWKTASEGCTLPGGCNVVGPEGVLGIEDWDEVQENPSGIWLGSIYHDSPDATDTEFAMLCPEGSFCSAYALNFGWVEIGPAGNPFVTLSIPPCGDNCGQGILIQNWLERPGVDLNTTVVIGDYGEPAAASYTEYPVDPQDAERFSEAYLTDQAENAHARRNNGSGTLDNDVFIQHIFSLPDLSYTILGHTEAEGWFLIWTNVQNYGEH